ncbi:maleylpyruvate isomerase family mycothiol-dependent enzyme [Saccharothrix obliqua]|uniref:maleylpyruvate isomerase family mycothiol-dependent enzyme n=1 Tax=Saccharothrix obliqua TaxID=2861747 RepID=UPI001C5E0145|nr:maleylpyruvate isomerase family mycothiol-dependent enzyme [Saccharothrix obliqua]MBW4722249.1 maleylpyruvate isomerase family mycothiol-dependent enzyme [Saccharothrix obliqua]
MTTTNAAPVEAVYDAHRRLGAVIEGLTDAQVGEPSLLPDWTRGHVLAHLANVTAALARQAEHEGELIEVYPGGRPARNAAIEAEAGRTAAEHRAAIEAAVTRLTAAWNGVRNWDSRVAHRDGVLRDTVFALWREVEIHTFDLDLADAAWSAEFCEHAVEFLTPRVPDGVRLTLASTDDGREWTIGSGDPVELRGERNDLVAWLAGREPRGTVTGERPALNPWP